jgi:hypothetical protein
MQLKTKATTTSLQNLEAALTFAVTAIRAQLQQCENLPSFELNISAKGRVHEGDVTVTYSIEEYYGEAVKGGRLEPVLVEFARRHGWKHVNAPICLSFNGNNAPLAQKTEAE